MNHSPITLIAEIHRGRDVAAAEQRLGELGRELRAMLQETLGADAKGTAAAAPRPELRELLRPLVELPGVHFLSFLVIPAQREGDPAYVSFELSVDGDAAPLRRRLGERAPGLLQELFRDCVANPEVELAGAELQRFLEAHDRPVEAFYVGCPGRSLEQIRRERELRDEARRLLRGLAPQSARDAWQKLAAGLRDLRARQSQPQRPFWVRWGANADGFPERLSTGLRRVTPFAALALGGLGLYWLSAESAAWLLLPAGLWGAAALALPGEIPVQLSAEGRQLAWRQLLRTWALDAPPIFVGLGVLAVALHGLAWIAREPALAGLWAGALLGLGLLATVAWLAAAALGFGLGAAVALPLAVTWALLALPAVGVSWPAAAALPALHPLSPLPALFGLGAFLAIPAFSYIALGRRAGGVLALAAALTAAVLAAYGAASPGWLTLGAAALWVGTLGPVAAVLGAVRRLERTDEEAEIAWDVTHLSRVQQHEDWFPQNHYAVVSRLRRSPLRRPVLRAVLRALGLIARVYFNRGYAGDVRSLHFFRFLLLPDGERMVFLTNYDGAWSSYLHDFSTAPLITGVWSNTLGFPRSFFLLWDGAHDEQRYKWVARRDQVQTLGWWSAYPDLRVADIDTATELRENLQREPLADNPDLRQRLAQRFASRPPLGEAECDRAWRQI